MKSRNCAVCNKLKPLNQYHKGRAYADGHIKKCKECCSEYHKKWSLENWPRMRDKHREWVKNNIGKFRKRMREYKREYSKRPDARFKDIVRRDTRAAIASGKLNRSSCEVCGESKVHAHHDDYGKSFQVRWLCLSHHVEHHKLTKLEK
ncbi:MAG TPA: hypothetical protein ENI23_17270 [bacterium]|nr:hypothetical protein [bacterium]